MTKMCSADERISVDTIRLAAGRRAREEAGTIDRLTESLRLASFRCYLAQTVVSMSVLVPEVLELARSDPAGALQRIRPNATWPASTAKEDEFGQTGARRNRKVTIGGIQTIRPAMFVGDAVMSECAFGAWIEAKVAGGSLDVVLRDQAFQFSTQDGTGYIRLPGQLPDTVVEACKGRPLAEVVDHPLWRSRSFVIQRAAQVSGSTSLAFEVGRLDLEVPWRP